MSDKLVFLTGEQKKPRGRSQDDIGLYADYRKKTDLEVLLATDQRITRAAKEALRRGLVTRQDLISMGIIER